MKKLYRVTAWVLRFINNLKGKVHNEVLNLSRYLDRTEISASELLWLHDNQKNIIQSKNYCQLEKSLVLITDGNGLHRSRGRLHNAPLPYDSREPILLDNRYYLTELIVQDAHCKVLHNRVKQTLTHIRERFWICTGRSYVKGILSKCLICKRLMGKPYDYPESPPLPSSHLRDGFAFSSTGVRPLWCLRKILRTAKLSYDEMFTVLAEVEVVLNNRPLTYVYAEETECCLTPNHLLIGRTPELEASGDERSRERSNLTLRNVPNFLTSCWNISGRNGEQSMSHHYESTTSRWTQAVRVDQHQ